MLRRTPLAWLNLVHNKGRLLAAIAGVSFAVLLMFVELGFWYALLDSMVALIDRFDADLVVVHRAKYSLTASQPFTRRRLLQAEGVPGVRSARPLYMEFRYALWKNPEGEPDAAHRRPIRLLAFDPDAPVLALPELGAHAAELRLPDTVLVDVQSRPFYGRRAADLRRELSEKAVRVVGTFDLGADFMNDGNLIMSAENYARFFPGSNRGQSPLGLVEVGLIRLEDGADRDRVLGALREALPDDVAVMSLQDFAAQERGFWQTATPVGFIFGLGVAMGFGVGVIICYQILAADVADHLSEYATLKAIGYHNSYLTGVVLQEAVLLALVGFAPGALLSGWAYSLLASATGLPLHLTPFRGALVLVLTVAMCVVSGLIVIRKVQGADPAEVFR